MATPRVTQATPSGSTLRHTAFAQRREGLGWGHITGASAPNLSPSLGKSGESATSCSRDLAEGGLTHWDCISKGEGANGFEQRAGTMPLLPSQLGF